MFLATVVDLGKQQVMVFKDKGEVVGVSRDVTISTEHEDIRITLTGGDALVTLKKGQRVIVDLGCDSYRDSINGEWKDEYYVKSITPLEKGAKIEFIIDVTPYIV